MATGIGRSRAAEPKLARVGFDHGWLRLSPTFLNLGFAGLLVDSLWTGHVADLGFEVLGRRNPCHPFPDVQIVTELQGIHNVRLSHTDHQGRNDHAIASNMFTASHDSAWWAAAHRSGQLLVFVGDTYRVGLSWAAIFDCAVGLASVATSHKPALRTPTRMRLAHLPACPDRGERAA